MAPQFECVRCVIKRTQEILELSPAGSHEEQVKASVCGKYDGFVKVSLSQLRSQPLKRKQSKSKTKIYKALICIN